MPDAHHNLGKGEEERVFTATRRSLSAQNSNTSTRIREHTNAKSEIEAASIHYPFYKESPPHKQVRILSSEYKVQHRVGSLAYPEGTLPLSLLTSRRTRTYTRTRVLMNVSLTSVRTYLYFVPLTRIGPGPGIGIRYWRLRVRDQDRDGRSGRGFWCF